MTHCVTYHPGRLARFEYSAWNDPMLPYLTIHFWLLALRSPQEPSAELTPQTGKAGRIGLDGQQSSQACPVYMGAKLVACSFEGSTPNLL